MQIIKYAINIVKLLADNDIVDAIPFLLSSINDSVYAITQMLNQF